MGNIFYSLFPLLNGYPRLRNIAIAPYQTSLEELDALWQQAKAILAHK
ncbi:hypothetical protein [Planktothrix paucivesiculata]|nr:hypothetical protein [Planktothrix paucivesiculata]